MSRLPVDNLYSRIPTDENSQENCLQNGLRCDFVLVHDVEQADQATLTEFERSLHRQGLVLEAHPGASLCYTKIHANNYALKRNCEIMRMRMPVKDEIRNNVVDGQQGEGRGRCTTLLFVLGYVLHVFGFRTRFLGKVPYKMTEEYSRDKSFLFHDSHPGFFSLSDRSMIVNFILERARFSKDKDNVKDVGLSKLLEDKVYLAAYPPHEGALGDAASCRGQLVEQWASWRSLFRLQPLDTIKDYFGMKIALYFAWLGFYTDRLVVATLLSVAFIMYGMMTWQWDVVGAEVCDSNSSTVMCPLCDNNCDYWELQEACWYYRVRYLVDNRATPLYVFGMSLWSAMYVKQWQRYSAEIKHRWGYRPTTLYPEFIRKRASLCCAAALSNHKRARRLMRLPSFLLSGTVVVFLIAFATICVLLTILYNMLIIASQFIHGELWTKYQQSLWVPVTSGILYYMVILVANLGYDVVARKLTEWEFHRTQTEFDDSLYMKMYAFQFISYYFIFFYLAFIKGKFIGHPGQYIRVLGFRQEECEPGGCLMEICIQIVLFMLVEQLRDNAVEYLWPLLKKSWARCEPVNWWRRWLAFLANLCRTQREERDRWLNDFHLNAWSNNTLFDEYLEMVLQFGYIAIFTAACPFAPILALFNNFFIEIRLDAKKFIKLYRRPIAERLPNTDSWTFILACVSRLSVLTNAWIIASSTDFVPIWVYRFNVDDSAKGFVNYSLSHFDVSDFENASAPRNSSYNVSSCRYFDYRQPHGAPDEYHKSLHYWHIVVAKLVFILAYNVCVSAVVTVFDWFVSNVPSALQHQIRKEENYILDEVLNHLND